MFDSIDVFVRMFGCIFVYDWMPGYVYVCVYMCVDVYVYFRVYICMHR